MSNYPAGTPDAYYSSVMLFCRVCGERWESEALTDLGSTDVENPFCPECDSEGEIN